MRKRLFILFALPMLWGLIGCSEEEPVVTPSPYPNPGPETKYEEAPIVCVTMSQFYEREWKNFIIVDDLINIFIYPLISKDKGDEYQINDGFFAGLEAFDPNLVMETTLYNQYNIPGFPVECLQQGLTYSHNGMVVIGGAFLFTVPEVGEYPFKMIFYIPSTGKYLKTKTFTLTVSEDHKGGIIKE